MVESDVNDGVVDANDKVNTEIPIVEIEEKIEPSEVMDAGFWIFELYKRAYPLKRIDERGFIRKEYDIAWNIISVEQPIHF